MGPIGTDTAGSIRLPAAYCGITGLKPTYGLVSTRGVIPLSWSLDHVGPMARTAADAALMLQAIAAYDPQDIYCQKFPPVYYPSAIEEKTAALRLGVARDFWNEVDGEITLAVDAAVAALGKITAGVQDIDLYHTVDRTLVRCEPYAYHQKYLPQQENDYDPETLKRIRSGADVTAAQYIQAYRELLQQRRQILQTFERIDLILTPTAPVLPPSLSDLQAAPDQLRGKELFMLRNTRPFNIYGLPSISVNCGFSKSGLPIGLQITGAPGAEGAVLALAHVVPKSRATGIRRSRTWMKAEACDRGEAPRCQSLRKLVFPQDEVFHTSIVHCDRTFANGLPHRKHCAPRLPRATLRSPRFDRILTSCYSRNAGWSSLVARWAHNPKVGGSNPPPATNLFNHLHRLAKIARERISFPCSVPFVSVIESLL